MRFLLMRLIHLPVLIDTWWNVNFFQTLKLPVQLLVLIDTWWNVNKKLFNLSFTPFVVLIDTWWNVNKICSCKMCWHIMF